MYVKLFLLTNLPFMMIAIAQSPTFAFIRRAWLVKGKYIGHFVIYLPDYLSAKASPSNWIPAQPSSIKLRILA
jgi:hypothetical protein